MPMLVQCPGVRTRYVPSAQPHVLHALLLDGRAQPGSERLRLLLLDLDQHWLLAPPRTELGKDVGVDAMGPTSRDFGGGQLVGLGPGSRSDYDAGRRIRGARAATGHAPRHIAAWRSSTGPVR